MPMTTLTLNTTQTTFVSSAQPTNNFSFYPLMYVGTDPTFATCNSFLKYTLPALPPNAVIDSASLQLSVIVKTGAAPSPITVNRVTSALDTSTVTYATQPTFVATPTVVNVTAADLYTAVQFDVTELVKQWYVGTYVNNGFALTNLDGTTLVQFATNVITWAPYFPRLVINYHIPPTTIGTGGASAQLTGSSGGTIADAANVIFAAPSVNQLPSNISYNSVTGVFTLTASPATNANYYVSWWVATNGAAAPVLSFSVKANGTVVSSGNTQWGISQVFGNALVTVGATPVTVTLTNTSGGTVNLATAPVQANISILKIS